MLKNMTWNYRIIKYDTNKNIVYRIHEVFYDEKGKIEGFTEDAVFAQGETVDELISDLQMMINDAKKYPILSLKELNKQLCKIKTQLLNAVKWKKGEG